jgi:hypothetical protein
MEVLRLNFKPVRITAGQTVLTGRDDLKEPGYTLEPAQADYVVRLRHAGSPDVVVEGK